MMNIECKCKLSHDKFVEYYEKQSETLKTRMRFIGIKQALERFSKQFCGDKAVNEKYNVVDIGCGAGTQCILWALEGHRVHGLDINEKLLEIAEKRAGDSILTIDFRIGSAAKIPWDGSSMDICLVPELLEHVEEWEICLDEFARILAPNGLLFISTSNKLCPWQNEFTLPLYSWYPKILKNVIVRLSKTSKPQFANFARFPAVNWFTFYQLKRELAKRGFECYDRFDVMDMDNLSKMKKFIAKLIKSNRILRLVGHIGSPPTIVFGAKIKRVRL